MLYLPAQITWCKRCPTRWFITDDVDMLEDDLAQLQALFEAEGTASRAATSRY